MKHDLVLVIEDDPDGRRSVHEAILDAGFDVADAPDAQTGIDAFLARSPAAVLCDLVLPDRDGLAVLDELRRIDDTVPILLMTAYGSVDTAVAALKAGAYDYITKPLDLDDLQAKIARAAETSRLRRQLREHHDDERRRHGARAMIADSPSMQDVIRRIEAVAPTQATVLILGESGTGKELVARALHVDGKRVNGPFVAVNCGAFSESLLESELFGHEKGAFTGAAARREGAFERADGGTLFLDEIGIAPPAVQTRLLRALEQREVTRVGGEQTINVDVRIVAASNRDLWDLVQEGAFRNDLLYRLQVVTIRLPPLRDRPDDIRPLTDRFLAETCRMHGRHIDAVDPSFRTALERHSWPGNVRELRNVVESAVIMAATPTLTADAVSFAGALPSANGDARVDIPATMTLEALEREAILQALRRCGGNRTLAAESLGVSTRTIQRKIKDYQLPF